MNEKRIRVIKKSTDKAGPIIYWMSRDQRVHDNWALIFAQKLALEKKSPLIVVFCLNTNFLGATERQFGFMLKGLREAEIELRNYNIVFNILIGTPHKTLPKFLTQIRAGALIADFDPLKIKKNWKDEVAKQIDISFYEVDAHNIVPCFYVSQKEEFAAYTLRPKIEKALPEFLEEYTKIQKMKSNPDSGHNVNWEEVENSLKIDRTIKEVNWLKPGETSALKIMNEFINTKLESYSELRNDPTKDAQSNLSPYLHFGQISAQRIALNIEKLQIRNESINSFLDELIIRKELADNYCFYNSNYDNYNGFRDWAKKSLEEHRKDEREFVYKLEQFEQAQTHDQLWNAAQNQLLTSGKMHGFMRMYWAKKILEWASSPEEALRISIYLNDKYELDGRDPNGYAGCAWSIGGIHDRAWFDRAVFGKIRYMNYNGCKRKFDVERYCEKQGKSNL